MFIDSAEFLFLQTATDVAHAATFTRFGERERSLQERRPIHAPHMGAASIRGQARSVVCFRPIADISLIVL
jgi:hypothetical protein